MSVSFMYWEAQKGTQHSRDLTSDGTASTNLSAVLHHDTVGLFCCQHALLMDGRSMSKGHYRNHSNFLGVRGSEGAGEFWPLSSLRYLPSLWPCGCALRIPPNIATRVTERGSCWLLVWLSEKLTCSVLAFVFSLFHSGSECQANV